MAKIIETNIDQLIPDDINFNKGTEYGQHLMENSFRKFGAGRSILLDKNNRIIAGNKATENAGAIGIEDVIIVETDGTKLVAVKRTDIDLDSEKGRELALADNATTKANLAWDEENITKVCEQYNIDIEDWGVSVESLSPDGFADDFSLKSGDKEPIQQMTFTLADEQACLIKNAIEEIKKIDAFKGCETFGNENTNGNALYLIISQWVERKK